MIHIDHILDDLCGGELVGLHAGVELGVLDADPLLGDDGDDVVAAHHLLALSPQVVHAQLHVRHTCTTDNNRTHTRRSTSYSNDDIDS